jgi:hypothetical protein
MVFCLVFWRWHGSRIVLRYSSTAVIAFVIAPALFPWKPPDASTRSLHFGERERQLQVVCNFEGGVSKKRGYCGKIRGELGRRKLTKLKETPLRLSDASGAWMLLVGPFCLSCGRKARKLLAEGSFPGRGASYGGLCAGDGFTLNLRQIPFEPGRHPGSPQEDPP